MGIIGNDVVEVFKLYCKEKSKLFIPDSPRQDEIASSLAEHYDSDDLLEAIKFYVTNEPGPILVFDFALKSRDYVSKIQKERASVDRFKQTVAETRKLIHKDEL
jgi:hypothetical protein